MNSDFLNDLNESQREAVLYTDGPSLVIAGAGSGKTRVLTYKIAWLLLQGLKPWSILALTFTNKAAKEMKERIANLVGIEQARYLQMGTFHSIFARILRANANRLGFSSNFTIYDQGDSRSLIKTIIKELELDDKTYKHTAVADRISLAKNHLMLPADYATSTVYQTDIERKQPHIIDIYKRYQERCHQSNAMDFDDLLVNTWLLFRNHEDIRKKYSEQFAFVLVDEYQDTNYAQQQIVSQISEERQMVCVVGDDAQSIYSFRGANIDNILDFRKQYNGAKLFKLEQNYRSTQKIVAAANSLIRHNERQIPKNVFSEKDEGDKLRWIQSYSDREEAAIVCKKIRQLKLSEQGHWSDFAILYRTNSQSRSFEEQMRKDAIPYRIYGGLSFYQRKEIKDIIAYFRLVANNDDEEAFRRIINYPTRGIGATTEGKIIDSANKFGVSLWQVISQPQMFQLNLSGATMKKIESFRTMVEEWTKALPDADAYELASTIYHVSGMHADIYSSREPEYQSKQENIEEMFAGLNTFIESRREEGSDNISLTDFLQEVSLMTDIDSDEAGDDKVSLMTIHSAKGLEFPSVFIVGMEENIFPSSQCAASARGLEEERRLFYVAITRAERHCTLTSAQYRYRYGNLDYNRPSRFINDIDPSLLYIDKSSGGIQMQNAHPVAHQFKADPMPKATASRYDLPSRFKPVSKSNQTTGLAKNHDLKPGDIIEHQRFGIGKVIQVEGYGENAKATIEFTNLGIKQLLLKFAKYVKR